MSGTKEFCTCEPYLEGEEVIDSQKSKADIPMDSKFKSHRPDKVHQDEGWQLQFNEVLEELFQDLQEEEARPDAPIEHPSPIENCRAPYVTAIQETTCNELEWTLQGCQ